jgi:hypothetical protein
MNGVHGTAANDVWAVGDGGLIAHFDGAAWTVHPTGFTAKLNAVWARSPTDVWVAGEQGKVLRWDGQRWREIFASMGNFVDLWADSTGAHGVGWSLSEWFVAHYRDGDAQGPRMVLSPAPMRDLEAIWGVEGGPLFVGGDDYRNVVARFTGPGRSPELGDGWKTFPLGDGTFINYTAERVHGLWGRGPNDVWAVASTTGSGSFAFHFDGQTWTRGDVPYWGHGQIGLTAVTGTADEVWVAGEEDAILRLRR